MEMNIPQLRERAEFGSSVAETTLGICYLYGIDVEVDCREAFRLLSTAAGKGVPRAAVNLARMYAEGPGEKGRKGVRRIFYRIPMKPPAPASVNHQGRNVLMVSGLFIPLLHDAWSPRFN